MAACISSGPGTTPSSAASIARDPAGNDYRLVIPVAGWFITAALLQGAPAAADSEPRPRLVALPVVSYSDVTGVQFGGTLYLSFRVRPDSGTRPSALSAYAAATVKDHAKAYVQLDHWSGRNTRRWRARVEYISFPLPFFGIGPATPDSAEEWYSSGVSTVQMFRQDRWSKSVYLHSGFRAVRSRLRETEPDGALRTGTIDGSSGSTHVMPELGIVMDSRDNTSAPRTGTYARLISSGSLKSLATEPPFLRLTLDARHYRRFLDGGVAAFQLQYDGIGGSAPFDLMPMIGADTAMRGYPRGRYRDRHALTAQAELRSGHYRRVGLVGFAGVGVVGPAVNDLLTGIWYPSLGAGIRYVLSPRERTVARIDLAIGRGSFGINLGLGEAF